MPGKHNAGGCGCCGVTTCVCNSLSYFTISGLSNSTCPSGCNPKNGTYVFRSAPGGCNWSANWDNDNCGGVTAPGYYVGSYSTPPCSQIIPAQWGVGFQVVGGKLRVTVDISITATQLDAFTAVLAQTRQIAVFQKDFDACADAVGATLPLVSSTANNCSVGALGDFCNLLSATVTIG